MLRRRLLLDKPRIKGPWRWTASSWDVFFNHQDHSSSSNRVALISSRSPSGWKDDAASAQPASDEPMAW